MKIQKKTRRTLNVHSSRTSQPLCNLPSPKTVIVWEHIALNLPETSKWLGRGLQRVWRAAGASLSISHVFRCESRQNKTQNKSNRMPADILLHFTHFTKQILQGKLGQVSCFLEPQGFFWENASIPAALMQKSCMKMEQAHVWLCDTSERCPYMWNTVHVCEETQNKPIPYSVFLHLSVMLTPHIFSFSSSKDLLVCLSFLLTSEPLTIFFKIQPASILYTFPNHLQVFSQQSSQWLSFSMLYLSSTHNLTFWGWVWMQAVGGSVQLW